MNTKQRRIDIDIQDEEARQLYLLNEKSRMDYRSSINHVTQQGKVEGKVEMILEGFRLGIPLETIAQMAKQPLDYVRSVIDKKIKVKHVTFG
jgi:hypothetical protein